MYTRRLEKNIDSETMPLHSLDTYQITLEMHCPNYTDKDNLIILYLLYDEAMLRVTRNDLSNYLT